MLVKHIKDEAVIRFFAGLLAQANISQSLAPSCIYYAACELLGPQRTLGDEFAGVVWKSGRAKRLVWILLHAALLFTQGERVAGATAKLNLAVFLLRGDFVSLVDRILRVRRTLVAGAISDQQNLKFPIWLRWIFALSIAVQGASELAAMVRERLDAKAFEQAWNKASDSSAEEADGTGGTEGPNCTICLNESVRPTAAKCGHVFCWSCAILSFSKEGRCPSCRSETTIQELFPLEHYSLKTEPLWKLIRPLD